MQGAFDRLGLTARSLRPHPPRGPHHRRPGGSGGISLPTHLAEAIQYREQRHAEADTAYLLWIT